MKTHSPYLVSDYPHAKGLRTALVESFLPNYVYCMGNHLNNQADSWLAMGFDWISSQVSVLEDMDTNL